MPSATLGFRGWTVVPGNAGDVRTAYFVDDPDVFFTNPHNRREWNGRALTEIVQFSIRERQSAFLTGVTQVFVALPDLSLDDLDGFDLVEHLLALAGSTRHSIGVTYFRRNIRTGENHAEKAGPTSQTMWLNDDSHVTQSRVHFHLFTKEFFDAHHDLTIPVAAWMALCSEMRVFTASGGTDSYSDNMDLMLTNGLYHDETGPDSDWNRLALVRRNTRSGTLLMMSRPVYNVTRG